MSTMTEVAPAHSTLGASTCDRWANCPGSVKLCEGIPSTTSKYAEEGTVAHDWASKILEGKAKLLDIPEEEMRDAVATYVNYVWEQMIPQSTVKPKLMVEVRLDLSSIHHKMFGTADAVIYHPDQKLLQVIDYKHGAGVPVDVADNSQLLYYGLGAMLKLNLPVKDIQMTIVQPRCFHPDGPVRIWNMDAFVMLDFAAKLRDLALETEKPNAALIPGDHCRWCPAKATCPKLRGEAENLFLPVKKEELSATYPPEKLADTLVKLDMIEDWAKSVREFAYREAEAGRPIPGWKLVAKRATRKWIQGAEEALAKSGLSIATELMLETKLKTPAQLEKLVPKNEKEILEKFIVSESSGNTLVPESDKREAVTVKKVEFQKLETDIFS